MSAAARSIIREGQANPISVRDMLSKLSSALALEEVGHGPDVGDGAERREAPGILDRAK